jgi:pyridoxal 5'-phosphate synthase pdxT subunit
MVDQAFLSIKRVNRNGALSSSSCHSAYFWNNDFAMKMESIKVGVLDLQGDVIEHIRAIEACGAQAFSVKTIDDLMAVHALIIPGGESTTIGKLLHWYDLFKPLQKRIQEGMPVYGTCAGAILLSSKIEGKEQAHHLGVMDIVVERNAYGRQLDSFEKMIKIELNEEVTNVPAIFIRAPRIKSIGQKTQALAQCGSDVVLAREDNMLVSTFHPELTEDITIHQYFLSMIPHDSIA